MSSTDQDLRPVWRYVASAAGRAADHAVDAAAIAALYGLASTGTPEASTQVLAGAIVTVALGKRAADTYQRMKQ